MSSPLAVAGTDSSRHCRPFGSPRRISGWLSAATGDLVSRRPSSTSPCSISRAWCRCWRRGHRSGGIPRADPRGGTRPRRSCRSGTRSSRCSCRRACRATPAPRLCARAKSGSKGADVAEGTYGHLRHAPKGVAPSASSFLGILFGFRCQASARELHRIGRWPYSVSPASTCAHSQVCSELPLARS